MFTRILSTNTPTPSQKFGSKCAQKRKKTLGIARMNTRFDSNENPIGHEKGRASFLMNP